MVFVSCDVVSCYVVGLYYVLLVAVLCCVLFVVMLLLRLTKHVDNDHEDIIMDHICKRTKPI